MTINIKDLTFTYQKDTVFQRTALKDINLNVDDGEFIGILGASGSGKSTLMQHINGVISSKGVVKVNGVSLGNKGISSLAIAAMVGLVFQYPEHQIFCDTVEEELSFGCGNLGFSAEKTKSLTTEYLNKVGLDESYLLRSPFQLSGGEKRRVALASIFAMDTPILLLDEPTVGLDFQGKREIAQVIKDLHSKKGKTIIWVGHDLAEITTYAQRLVVLSHGKITADGSVSEVLNAESVLEDAGISFGSKLSLLESLQDKFKLADRGEEGQKILQYFMNSSPKEGVL